MAPARVRGCAGPSLPHGGAGRQADASRRRNGPRKATSRRPITVRLRSKSCPAGGPDVLRPGRRGVVADTAARPSAGGCGVEDQVGRAGVADVESCCPDRGGITSWTSSSRAGTPRSPTVSASTSRTSWPRSRSSTPKVISVDVECAKERNPRQADQSERVELTIRSRGPIIRAEAAAAGLLRRAGRCRGQAGGAPAQGAATGARCTTATKTPVSVAAATAALDAERSRSDAARRQLGHRRRCATVRRRPARWSCARSCTRPTPMNLDQALYEMELVGHDFYLFVDADDRRSPASSTGAGPTTTA